MKSLQKHRETQLRVHKYKCTNTSSLSRSNSLARHREWATPLVACPGSTFAAPSKKQKTNDVSPFSSAPANPHKICSGAKKLHVVTFQNPKTGIRAGDFWALCAIPGQLPAVEWRRHLKSYVTSTRPRKNHQAAAAGAIQPSKHFINCHQRLFPLTKEPKNKS